MTGDPAKLRGAARLYADPRIGWKVFPVWGVRDGRCECGEAHASPKDMGKHPLGGNGHLDATQDPDVLEAYWPANLSSVHNVGIPCESNGLVILDVDPRNGGSESWLRLEADLGGAIPRTLTALTGKWGLERGRHRYFLAPEGTTFHGKIEGYPGIDVKHKGYVLAPPSLHGSGETYEWEVPGGPLAVKPVKLPAELSRLIVKGTGRGGSGGAPETYGVLTWGGKRIDVDRVLSEGIAEGERINTLYPIMCAIANQYPVAQAHGEASFRAVIRVMNNRACRPPLPEDELEFQIKRAVDFVKANPKERMVERAVGADVMDWVADQRAAEGTVTSVEELTALSAGVENAAPSGDGGSLAELGAAIAANLVPSAPAAGGVGGVLPPDWDTAPIPDGKDFFPRSRTDMGNARRLADYYSGVVKYTEGMGWFIWDGGERRWLGDVGGALAMDRAAVLPGLVARELTVFDPTTANAEEVAKWSTESKSTARLKSAMAQWQVRPEVRAPVSGWDAKPELLGVRNGVVDLRTGALSPGDPSWGITKRTDVAYEKGTTAVRWTEFLDFATGGDLELQRWLQLAAGYTLTGRNDYDVFFIVFGQPGSGKSTFLEALSHVLGEQYSIHLPVTALIDDGRAAATDAYYWAQLPGRRMAVLSEWPVGKKTKEDAIKSLTGDLTMTGRHPGGQPFTFQSQAKLWLGTNVTPAITESAMWRRIRAIPFPYVPEKPDPDLKVWLADPEGGLPAVMAWCVEGAVRLLNSGDRDALGWCKAVKDASAEYRAQEDRMGQFLEEEATVGPGRSVPIVVLYETYTQWAEDRGERPMTRIPFEKALQERGVHLDGRGRHAVVAGYSLRPRVAADSLGAGSAAELRAVAAELSGR